MDFILVSFPILLVLLYLFSLDAPGGKGKKKDHDAVLTVAGDNAAAFKVSAGNYEYRYDELKNLAPGKPPKDDSYFGPPLAQVLATAGLTSYSSLLFYSAGSKNVQKLMSKSDVGGWIVAINKGEKSLSWADDGPYFLYKKDEKDKSKFVPRLLRIEAK